MLLNKHNDSKVSSTGKICASLYFATFLLDGNCSLSRTYENNLLKDDEAITIFKYIHWSSIYVRQMKTTENNIFHSAIFSVQQFRPTDYISFSLKPKKLAKA